MAELTELNVGQGETFKMLVSIVQDSGSVPQDLTGYNVVGQIRENYTTDEIANTFTITKLDPQTSGSFIVQLDPEQTINLTQRRYVYDINIVSGSYTRRILEGLFTVRPAATR